MICYFQCMKLQKLYPKKAWECCGTWLALAPQRQHLALAYALPKQKSFLTTSKSIQRTEQKDATSYVPQFYYLICNWCLNWPKILVFIIITLPIPNSGVREMIDFNTHQAKLAYSVFLSGMAQILCVCTFFGQIFALWQQRKMGNCCFS